MAGIDCAVNEGMHSGGMERRDSHCFYQCKAYNVYIKNSCKEVCANEKE